MSLIRWNPVRDLTAWPSEVSSLQREMNRVFDSFFRTDETSPGLSLWSPSVDIAERDDAYTVSVELPGVKKDDIAVSIENNILTITGEKKQEEKVPQGSWRRVERIYGSFQRSFTLPATVKADAIEAKFEDGILRVTVPKADEARQKQIEVKVR